ncbi:MAG: hypothetical protein V3W41_14555 [Planctomycetota bacterium]
MAETLYLTTPVGRLVQGNCFEGQTKDQQGRPLVNRQNEPKTVWYIGIAIPKGPEWDQMWSQISAKGQFDFPGGEWNLPDFSWKAADGDGPLYAGREGYAGCWILKCQGGYAPRVYDNQPQPQQIVNTKAIKRGDFVQVGLGVSGNGQTGPGSKPGVYMNPEQIMLAAIGAEIQTGADPAATFANRGALPPGAQPVPVGWGAPGAVPTPYGQPAMGPPGVPAPAPLPAQPQYAQPVAAPPVAAPPMPGAVAPPVVAPQPATPVAGPPAAPGVMVPGVPAGPAVAPAPGFLQPGQTAAPGPVPVPGQWPVAEAPVINPATGLPYPPAASGIPF